MSPANLLFPDTTMLSYCIGGHTRKKRRLNTFSRLPLHKILSSVTSPQRIFICGNMDV